MLDVGAVALLLTFSLFLDISSIGSSSRCARAECPSIMLCRADGINVLQAMLRWDVVGSVCIDVSQSDRWAMVKFRAGLRLL